MGSCLSAESRSPRPGTPSSPAFGVRKRKKSKKRPGSRNSSFDFRREEPLHRIPGRLFLNGSSDIASLFTQQGKKGTNQDAMIVWEVSSFFTFFCSLKDYSHWNAHNNNRNLQYILITLIFRFLPLQNNYSLLFSWMHCCYLDVVACAVNAMVVN
jgi:hypothetical protein